jgi:molecular chaperone GrpE
MAENMDTEKEETVNTEGSESGLEGVDVAPGAPEAGVAPEQQATEESGGELDLLRSELERARGEIAELRDAWTRERAEFQNYRKRIVQDQARSRVDSMTDFAKKLFPLIDNLERVAVVQTEDENLKNYVSGVEMVYQGFCETLKRESILKISPANEPFDPRFMEAIAMEEREGLSQDTVVEVFQAGYVFERDGERRSLRSAMVKVAKPTPK